MSSSSTSFTPSDAEDRSSLFDIDAFNIQTNNIKELFINERFNTDKQLSDTIQNLYHNELNLLSYNKFYKYTNVLFIYANYLKDDYQLSYNEIQTINEQFIKITSFLRNKLFYKDTNTNQLRTYRQYYPRIKYFGEYDANKMNAVDVSKMYKSFVCSLKTLMDEEFLLYKDIYYYISNIIHKTNSKEISTFTKNNELLFKRLFIEVCTDTNFWYVDNNFTEKDLVIKSINNSYKLYLTVIKCYESNEILASTVEIDSNKTFVTNKELYIKELLKEINTKYNLSDIYCEIYTFNKVYLLKYVLHNIRNIYHTKDNIKSFTNNINLIDELTKYLVSKDIKVKDYIELHFEE